MNPALSFLVSTSHLSRLPRNRSDLLWFRHPPVTLPIMQQDGGCCEPGALRKQVQHSHFMRIPDEFERNFRSE